MSPVPPPSSPPPPHGSIPRTRSNGQQPPRILHLHPGRRSSTRPRGRQCPPRRRHLRQVAGHGRRRRRGSGRRQAAGHREEKEVFRPPRPGRFVSAACTGVHFSSPCMRQSAHHSDHFPPIPASHVPPPHPHRTPPDRPASTATRRATCRQTIRQVRPSSRHSQKRRTRRSLQPRPRTVRHTPRHLRPPTGTFKSRKGPREIGTVKKTVECRDESVAGKPHDCPRCT